jgi:hypothetical protein
MMIKYSQVVKNQLNKSNPSELHDTPPVPAKQAPFITTQSQPPSGPLKVVSSASRQAPKHIRESHPVSSSTDPVSTAILRLIRVDFAAKTRTASPRRQT